MIPAITSDCVLLLGANGQVGTELRARLEGKCALHALTRAQADLSQPQQLRRVISDLRPGIILNAAAYTAVDRAESEPELATLINAAAPAALAEEAARYGGLLLHYSTDYVFNGSRFGDGSKHGDGSNNGSDSMRGAWLEDDPTGPLNVYGSTKLAGERGIAASGAAHLIFRTSWVFAPHSSNFLLTILRLARERDRLTIVADQHGAPTSAASIADGTIQVLESLRSRQHQARVCSGIYHMTCAGETSWHGFAQAIVDEARSADLLDGRNPEVVPIPSEQYPTPAKRPSNSVLDNGKLRDQFGVALPHWREALRKALQELSSTKRPAVQAAEVGIR